MLILSLLHLTDEAYSSPESSDGVVHDDSCLLKKQGMKHLRNSCVLPGAQQEKYLPFGIRCTGSTVGTAEINCAFGVSILTWITDTNLDVSYNLTKPCFFCRAEKKESY